MNQETLNVLLVDNNEDDYVITRDMLAEIPSYHVELEWTGSYAEALKRIASGEHSLFLVDYRLGARTGLDLVKEANESGCREPIILLTGQADRTVDLEAMRAGAADYIVKSHLNADMLDRSIRYSLERRRADMVRDKLISSRRFKSSHPDHFTFFPTDWSLSFRRHQSPEEIRDR